MQADKLATPSRPALALLLAAALLASPSLLAQGLGELSLESALNEPLRASIELLDVAGLEEGQLQVGIASAEEFAAAGLERSELLSRIEFDLELQPLGGGRVILTTTDRIAEPLLTLLVSARWPSGQVLRDYTVMLDLPATAGAQPTAAPAVAEPPVGTAAPAAAGQPAGDGEAYTVRRGDSLWQIAEQQRPGTDVSVPQMMIALQRANPEAFANNNINRLVSGRVLRIPSREEIAVIEPAAAVAQVNAQNREVGLMPLGGAGASAAAATRDELSVLTADAPETAAAGAGSSDLDATIAALEAELMLSEEELDRVRLENQELNARLDELQEQIAILQNIITIEDERIAQLQDELAAQAAVTDQALAEASRAAELLAAAEQAAPQGRAAQLLALLQNNLVLIGAALAVVLALLALLVAKARQVRDEDEASGFALDEGFIDGRPGSGAEAAGRSGADLAALGAVADAARNEEIDQLEAAPAPALGFLARLLARFRRAPAESAAGDAAGGAGPALPAAGAPATEVAVAADELREELASGLFAEDRFGTGATDVDDDLADFADDEAEADAAEADELASSVLEEADSVLAQLDAEDALRFDTERSLADAGQPELAPEPEPEPAPEPARTRDVAAAVAGTAAAGAAASAAVRPDIESFDFMLDPQAVAAAAAEPAAEPVEETFEFKPVGDNDGFDLGSLTFDESDARAADDDDGVYSSRAGMDECDTKLDLAVAYEAMGDIDGALEILEEVIAEGKPAQIEEAQRLKAKWQDA